MEAGLASNGAGFCTRSTVREALSCSAVREGPVLLMRVNPKVNFIHPTPDSGINLTA